VPRQLTAKLKERRFDACQELLKQLEAVGDGFLGRTVKEMKPGSTTTSRKAGKSERGMAPYLLTKTEKIPHTTICGKGYDDYVLG
jgi:hypothetical protein